jgi:hypothetical protein
MAQDSAYKTMAASSTEVFSTKILKVYEAHSPEGAYIAYVVDWRGREIVVVPSGAREPLKVGDALECTMRSSLASTKDGGKAVLRFTLENPMSAMSGDAERLEAIRHEVQRRRDARAAAACRIEKQGERPACQIGP